MQIPDHIREYFRANPPPEFSWRNKFGTWITFVFHPERNVYYTRPTDSGTSIASLFNKDDKEENFIKAVVKKYTDVFDNQLKDVI